MIKKIKRLFKSFVYAWHGVQYNFRTQQNFKIHCTAATLAIILAWFLKFSYTEWLILIFTIFAVIVLEAVNTAIEEAVNCATKEMNENAKIAKDSAACAVLIAAFMAVLMGVILYVPKIINLIRG